MKKLAIVWILLLGLGWTGKTKAQTTPDAQLQQYLTQLQLSAEDVKIRREIREKVIRLVASMASPPALPPEAEKHGFKADYLVTQKEFSHAAAEYAAASNLAPWVAQYYENWGNVLQTFKGTQVLENAKDKLELYLIAAPDAADRVDVRKKIAEIEVRMDQAKSAADNVAKHRFWRQFRTAVEGKTYVEDSCRGKDGHFHCTISEAFGGGPFWYRDEGRGESHWVFVGNAAYLVAVAAGDDIRRSLIRVRENESPNGNGDFALTEEARLGLLAEHPWRNDIYFLNHLTDSPGRMYYAFEAPASALDTTIRHSFYLVREKP